MTDILILLASIAVGVLLCLFLRKRGTGKTARRLSGVVAGFIALVVLVNLFGDIAPATAVPADQAPASPTKASPAATAAASGSDPDPRYTTANADAAAEAKHYIASVDGALEHSIAVSPGIDLKTAANLSRRFGALADQGEAMFGTGLDPLGACGMAGRSADTLWHTRIVDHDPTGRDTEAIQQSAQAYQEQRAACLALFR